MDIFSLLLNHRTRSNNRYTTDTSVQGTQTRTDSREFQFIDFALVATVPVVLVAVFTLPYSVRRDLALFYTQPLLRTMFASHFVHLSFPHLLDNLLIYLLVVPFSTVVSVWSGRRRRFYLVAFTIVVAFPFVLSGLNVLFPRPRFGVGFSGINLAFIGYLPHVLVDRLEDQYPEWDSVRTRFLPLAFFVATTIITMRVAESLNSIPQIGLWWLLVAGVGSAAAVVALVFPFTWCVQSQRVMSIKHSLIAAFGGGLFILLVVIGFPEVSPTDSGVVNLFLHLLGYSFGYIVPYVAFQLLGISLDSERPGQSTV